MRGSAAERAGAAERARALPSGPALPSEPALPRSTKATRLAFELGKTVRELREQPGWTQTQLAEASEMTQPAVASFGAGGTVPTIPVLERLAHAVGVELVVRFVPRSSAA